VNTWLTLSTVHKSNMTMAEYVGRMHSLGDDLAAAGRSLDDDELVEYPRGFSNLCYPDVRALNMWVRVHMSVTERQGNVSQRISTG
jgi:hypothetical protein